MLDDRHQQLSVHVQLITHICLSEEFGRLRRELEKAYLRCGTDRAMFMAFQDALYTMIAQEDPEFLLAPAPPRVVEQ